MWEYPKLHRVQICVGQCVFVMRSAVLEIFQILANFLTQCDNVYFLSRNFRKKLLDSVVEFFLFFQLSGRPRVPCLVADHLMPCIIQGLEATAVSWLTCIMFETFFRFSKRNSFQSLFHTYWFLLKIKIGFFG